MEPLAIAVTEAADAAGPITATRTRVEHRPPAAPPLTVVGLVHSSGAGPS